MLGNDDGDGVLGDAGPQVLVERMESADAHSEDLEGMYFLDEADGKVVVCLYPDNEWATG
jgi:hypothetical protein